MEDGLYKCIFIYLFIYIFLFLLGVGGGISYCCKLNHDTSHNMIAWNKLQAKVYKIEAFLVHFPRFSADKIVSFGLEYLRFRRLSNVDLTDHLTEIVTVRNGCANCAHNRHLYIYMVPRL